MKYQPRIILVIFTLMIFSGCSFPQILSGMMPSPSETQVLEVTAVSASSATESNANSSSVPESTAEPTGFGTGFACSAHKSNQSIY